jgi:hypothetical protein
MSGLKLERGLIVAVALVGAGLIGLIWLFRVWQVGGFGDLDPFKTCVSRSHRRPP